MNHIELLIENVLLRLSEHEGQLFVLLLQLVAVGDGLRQLLLEQSYVPITSEFAPTFGVPLGPVVPGGTDLLLQRSDLGAQLRLRARLVRPLGGPPRSQCPGSGRRPLQRPVRREMLLGEAVAGACRSLHRVGLSRRRVQLFLEGRGGRHRSLRGLRLLRTPALEAGLAFLQNTGLLRCHSQYSVQQLDAPFEALLLRRPVDRARTQLVFYTRQSCLHRQAIVGERRQPRE
mmetsp:Transcript_22637/g.63377  ORF Transcript_22637/g.63377 Transcript_22637/m.63377 type:complete len:231 (-) Transcript_22637:1236-1928(-)